MTFICKVFFRRDVAMFLFIFSVSKMAASGHEDLRFKFIRGLLQYERGLRRKHWEKANAEVVGRAIVALDLHDNPIHSARQAEVEITGIGTKIRQVIQSNLFTYTVQTESITFSRLLLFPEADRDIKGPHCILLAADHWHILDRRLWIPRHDAGVRDKVSGRRGKVVRTARASSSNKRDCHRGQTSAAG